jgi:hypothetical protein
MKTFLIVFCLLILISCGGSKEEAVDFDNMTFSLDTVMVDPGDEFLFLKWGLAISDLSDDKKHLYNFNLDDYTLERINLDELVLEEKLPFEKEGPNGTGEYLGSLNLYKDNQVFLSGYNNIGLYNLTGEKTKNFPMRDTKFEGDSLQGDESFNWRMVLDNEGKYLYGLIGSFTGRTYAFGKLDYGNKILKKFSLTSFERIADYQLMLKSDNMMMIFMPTMDLVEIDDRLILSNSVTSELSWYDMDRDSLFHKKFESKLTANEKKGKYRNELDSDEEFQKERKSMQQEINFMAPFWDEVNQRFYRFSFEELDIEVDRESGEKAKAKVYLTILDKDFNMLGESLVAELTTSPAKHFAKDGKIWIYENVEDELGFIRLAFD